ncbi:MAG: DJ-1/PfpI family protein [Ureaplasma sp.]|nr:DJ-1/PfpI family protein [Ureaplasma sp.]MDE6289447.1 DJ-1/PfpI family protein [Ureaplasma sp.]
MKKIAMILANGMKDYEIIIPLYIWKKAGLSVSLVSIEKKNSVLLETGFKLTCSDILEKINLSQYNAIYIPGGEGVNSFSFENWPIKKNVDSIKRFITNISKIINEEEKMLLMTDESAEILLTLKLLKELPSQITALRKSSEGIQKVGSSYFVKGYNALTDFSIHIAKILLNGEKLDKFKEVCNLVNYEE